MYKRQVIDGIKDAAYDEIIEITLSSGEKRIGRIIELTADYAVAQVFEGTQGISLINTRTRLTGSPLKITLSSEILGRTFDGVGRPIDGLGEIYGNTAMVVSYTHLAESKEEAEALEKLYDGKL